MNRYTNRELVHIADVAQRIVRHGLSVYQGMKYLMGTYGLGRRHSYESVRWYLFVSCHREQAVLDGRPWAGPIFRAVSRAP